MRLGVTARSRRICAAVLAPPVTLLGIVLGWILASLINLGVAGLLGTPVPSGISHLDLPPKGLAVPWPVSLLGVTLTLGLIYGAGIAVCLFCWRYSDHRRQFPARADGAPSPVAAYYRDRTTGAAGATAGDTPARWRQPEQPQCDRQGLGGGPAHRPSRAWPPA